MLALPVMASSPVVRSLRHPVASLMSTEALRRKVELVATLGPAQHDLDAVFAELDADPPGAIDAVRDLTNMPPAEEPEQVRRDLAAASSKSGNA